MKKRYIYLMEKRGDLYSRFTLQRLIKIGIATNKLSRLSQVNGAIKGPVKIIYSEKVFFADWLERFLHNTFSDSRTRLKRVGRGAGKTEWFYLNPLELLFIKGYIFLFANFQILLIVWSLIIAGFYLG